MAESREREAVIEELEAVLQAEDEAEKNFHVRQALQLLEVDGAGHSDEDGENRDAN